MSNCLKVAESEEQIYTLVEKVSRRDAGELSDCQMGSESNGNNLCDGKGNLRNYKGSLCDGKDNLCDGKDNLCDGYYVHCFYYFNALFLLRFFILNVVGIPLMAHRHSRNSEKPRKADKIMFSKLGDPKLASIR